VVRRGDTMTPRTWTDVGVRLRPEFSAGFASWVARSKARQAARAPRAVRATAAAETVPRAAARRLRRRPRSRFFRRIAGPHEYTVEIDGQVLRYRNAAPAWTNFVWPNPSGHQVCASRP